MNGNLPPGMRERSAQNPPAYLTQPPFRPGIGLAAFDGIGWGTFMVVYQIDAMRSRLSMLFRPLPEDDTASAPGPRI